MTYEYVCTACGHQWEAQQAISAAPLKTCPNCGTDHARRQVSGGAGFILKGGGWYADGYGSSKAGSGGAAGSSTINDAPGAKAGEAKTETKPESKVEAKTEAPKTSTGTNSST